MATTTANVGFEETLWKAADKLRGSMDASDYKHVVLGLIFLKYISEKFETKYKELVEEGDGFEEEMKFGMRKPGLKRRISARTSIKRQIVHRAGLKSRGDMLGSEIPRSMPITKSTTEPR